MMAESALQDAVMNNQHLKKKNHFIHGCLRHVVYVFEEKAWFFFVHVCVFEDFVFFDEYCGMRDLG